MHGMNEYLPTTPFDLYELHLFHLVAPHHSFTKAAEVAGLTQSAVTRQVQGIAASLGLSLFERTARNVQLTPAGQAWWRESVRLVGDVASLRLVHGRPQCSRNRVSSRMPRPPGKNPRHRESTNLLS